MKSESLEVLPSSVRTLIVFFFVAFAGGAAKSLIYRKPNWKWFDTFAQAFASGFTGFIVGTLALRWLGADHTDIVLSLAGLSGWIGPSLMDYFAGIAGGLLRAKARSAGLEPAEQQQEQRQQPNQQAPVQQPPTRPDLYEGKLELK